MSGWKIILRDLANAGGGPLKRSSFDKNFAGGLTDYAFKRLKELGLAKSKKHGDGWYWNLTQRGCDLHAGRVMLGKERSASVGNRRDLISVSWIAPIAP